MKTMKTLFIIHSTNMIYGAAKSLSTITRNWDDEFDIIFPKDFPGDFLKKNNHLDETEIRNFYGKKLKKIYYAWLPFVFPLDVEYKETIKWKLKYFINYVLGKVFQFHIYQIINKNQYDIIHLNSIILFPLLTSKYPMYIHVREISGAGRVLQRCIINKLSKARGVIFIDKATEIPFSAKLDRIQSIVLNNPFDMSGIELLDKKSIRQRYHINDDEIVYTIAGNVSEVKGVDFVIQSFVKTNRNAKLLVVGSGEKKFLDKCKKIINSDSRVVFTGELVDMRPIYAISDYIVRGDAHFCIGRTIYEGLYSGAGTIIPGNLENSIDIFEYERFRKKIFFYTPRNSEALQTNFDNCGILSNEIRIGMSNINEYLGEFNKFISKDGNE